MTDSGSARRVSGRQRMRPLEFWVNERVVYEGTPQGPKLIGVLTQDPRGQNGLRSPFADSPAQPKSLPKPGARGKAHKADAADLSGGARAPAAASQRKRAAATEAAWRNDGTEEEPGTEPHQATPGTVTGAVADDLSTVVVAAAAGEMEEERSPHVAGRVDIAAMRRRERAAIPPPETAPVAPPAAAMPLDATTDAHADPAEDDGRCLDDGILAAAGVVAAEEAARALSETEPPSSPHEAGEGQAPARGAAASLPAAPVAACSPGDGSGRRGAKGSSGRRAASSTPSARNGVRGSPASPGGSVGVCPAEPALQIVGTRRWGRGYQFMVRRSPSAVVECVEAADLSAELVTRYREELRQAQAGAGGAGSGSRACAAVGAQVAQPAGKAESAVPPRKRRGMLGARGDE